MLLVLQPPAEAGGKQLPEMDLLMASELLQGEFLAAEIDTATGALTNIRAKTGALAARWQPCLNRPLQFAPQTDLPETWPVTQASGNKCTFLRATDGALTVIRGFVMHDRSIACFDQFANTSPAELELLYSQRIEFSPRLLNETGRLDVLATGFFDAKDDPPLRLRWPHANDGSDLTEIPKGSVERKLHVTDLSEGRCQLTWSDAKLGVAWNIDKLPYCWLDSGVSRFAVEPATGLPDALEEGHGLLRLAPGQVEIISVELHVLS